MTTTFFSILNAMNDYDPASNTLLGKCNDHFLKYKYIGLTFWKFNALLFPIQLLRPEDLILRLWHQN